MSNLPDLIDWLVGKCRADATLTAAAVEVFDGPIRVEEPLPAALWIGLDDMEAARNGDPTSPGTSVVTWAALGRRARNEEATLYGVAAAWTGDDDFSPLRATTKTIIDAVELIVRDGTDAPAVFPSAPMTATWQQLSFNGGIQVLMPFEITYTARI